LSYYLVKKDQITLIQDASGACPLHRLQFSLKFPARRSINEGGRIVIVSGASKSQIVDVNELQYYFDAVERDSLDRQGHSRRSSEVLAIRDKLLTLPDKEFEAAVQTIKNILNPNGVKTSGADENKVKKQQAADLYEMSRTEKPLASLKAGSV
jgi:hypothetical protein